MIMKMKNDYKDDPEDDEVTLFTLKDAYRNLHRDIINLLDKKNTGLELYEQEDLRNHMQYREAAEKMIRYFSVASEGDAFFEEVKNGENKQEKKLVVVETVETFKHTYIIECDEISHALDEVVINNVEEFSQERLGENIFGSSEISREEYEKMVKKEFGDFPHGERWTSVTDPERYIHKIDYDKR